MCLSYSGVRNTWVEVRKFDGINLGMTINKVSIGYLWILWFVSISDYDNRKTPYIELIIHLFLIDWIVIKEEH